MFSVISKEKCALCIVYCNGEIQRLVVCVLILDLDEFYWIDSVIKIVGMQSRLRNRNLKVVVINV